MAFGSNRKSRRRAGRRARFERLETRNVLATFTVTNLNDFPVTASGAAPGTLRQAIFDANQSSDVDEIRFAADLSGTLDLSYAGDTFAGVSALVISSPISIRGNTAGITLRRGQVSPEMRLFHVTAAGDLTLDSLTVTGGSIRGVNRTTPGEAGGSARGGAIYNEGTLQIIACTFYENHAVGGNAGAGGVAGDAQGGAIFNQSGTVTISNATLSNNYVQSGSGTTGGSYGGAVSSFNGTTTIRSSTLTENAALSGRGLYVRSENGVANVNITSSIIGQQQLIVSSRDLLIVYEETGQLNVTGSNNLIRWQNDFDFITVNTEDPKLGPLANNGGPTMTHALLTDSPAINFGSNLPGFGNDQRGANYLRVAGSAADVGAYELQSEASATQLGDYNLDSSVDAADFVLWRNTRGATVPRFTGADGDGSGLVDANDYSVWRGHFGSTGSATDALAMAQGTTVATSFVAGEAVSQALDADDEPTSLTNLEAARIPQPWTLRTSSSQGSTPPVFTSQPGKDINLALAISKLPHHQPAEIPGQLDAAASNDGAMAFSVSESNTLDEIFATWSNLL